MLSLTEWFWTKIGFGLISAIAGVIWGIIFFPILIVIDSNIELKTSLITFATVFIIVSLINEKIIEGASLGAIYALLGYLFGFLAHGGTVANLDGLWEKCGKELAACFVLGIISSLLLMVLYTTPKVV